jgi:RNA polymerase sigma factor (sigma-70 family)
MLEDVNSNRFQLLQQQLASGDAGERRRGMNDLVLRYMPHIRRIIKFRLEAKMRTQRGESGVLQSVWLKVMNQLNDKPLEFKTEEKLLAYLATVTKSKMADIANYLNAAKRGDGQRPVSIDQGDGLNPIDVEDEEASSPSFRMRIGEWRELLNSAVDEIKATVSEEDWDLIQQFYYEEKSLAEIADSVTARTGQEISADGIRMRLKRIRLKLQKHLSVSSTWWEV